MLGRYVLREMTRNPRRSLVSLLGVALSIGLFSAVLFFVDGSSSSMTRRALAPLAIDMQRVLSSPLGEELSFSETRSPQGALRAGQSTLVTLTLWNRGSQVIHEVVVKAEPPAPLGYVPESTRIDGRAVRDISGGPPLAHGPARLGLNLGSLPPNHRVTLTYRARAARSLPGTRDLRLQAMVSSSENPVPSPANRAAQLGLPGLARQVATLPRVDAADPLAFVDLAPGSLSANGVTVRRPVRVFAFDRRYTAHHPSIAVVRGTQRGGSALLNAEAARTTGTGPGDQVVLRLPGRRQPLTVPVSGIADLSQARPLFYSRESTNLEKFLYVPDSVVVDVPTFLHEVVPGFRAERSRVGPNLKTSPLLELDVSVRRGGLRSDPASALAQTRAVAAQIRHVGRGQDYLIDNISNTLAVAADDAVVAKKMFLFLGLPAGLLAALLTVYAGGVLASTTRREAAVLRLRGATRAHLTTIVLYRSLALAGIGSILGCVLGFVAAAVALGPGALAQASVGGLLTSAAASVCIGVCTTAVACYVPGHRSLRRDVRPAHDESVELSPPSRGMAVAATGVFVGVAAAEILLARSGVFDTAPGSVYDGRPVSLPSALLSVPMAGWVAGVTAAVLVLGVAMSSLPTPAAPRFGPLTSGTFLRTLKRRSASLAGAVAALALVVAFSVALASFGATYDSAKAADSRFLLGSDIRVTPSVVTAGLPASRATAQLRVPGATAVAPVVFRPENALASGPYGQEREDLAALDPAEFQRAAPVPDAAFQAGSAGAGMKALADHPRGVLLGTRAAEALQVGVGDRLPVLLDRNTAHQHEVRLVVVGVISDFPAFPEGVDLVMNRSLHAQATGSTTADFYLVSAARPDPRGVAEVANGIRGRPVGRTAWVQTAQSILDKNQSSLTALNVTGLLRIDFVFTLAMICGVLGIFVFGLLLHRRKEYVALRALGMYTWETAMLVLAETATVAAAGLGIGLLVGEGMAVLLSQALRALFVLDPVLTVPSAVLLLVAGFTAAMALAASVSAVVLLTRWRPTEVLRDT